MQARQDWLDTVYDFGDFLMKTGDVDAAGEQFRSGQKAAEQILSADPASAPARRTTANFSEKLGDYYARLASAKGTMQSQRLVHWRQADVLYRRASDLIAELPKQAKLTAEDKKSVEELSSKLAHSARVLSAAGPGSPIR